MSLASEMKECLGGEAGCHAALLVDIDDGLALAECGLADDGGAEDGRVSSATLAAAVCEILGRAQPAALAAAAADSNHAVIAVAEALHVIHRLEDAPGRALLLSFPADTAADVALEHARARQAAVAGAGLW